MSRELVGRHEELSHVERFLEAAKEEPRVLLIHGEAGAGKTSVWEAGLASAQASGTRTLAARPVEAETGFGYAALGDMLRDDHEAVSVLPLRQRHALEVALRLAERTDSPDQASVGLAVHGVLTQLAEEKPLVVAVDDVQWLDAPSALVLGFAVRRLRSGPIALLVAWRTDDGAAPAPLELDRSGLADTMERLALPALSFGAVQRLLQQRLDIVPPRPVLRRLYELSAGNPFFALELGRGLRAGTLELEPGERLPVPLEGVVGTRLESLSASTRRMLAAAALIAQPTVALVEAVSGAHQAAFDEAERADVIDIREGRIRFSHPLLASASYAAATPSDRRELHTRAATTIQDTEERARHLAFAATGPDGAVAAELESAASRAESRGAPPAAAELYERAVRLTPDSAEGDRLRRTIQAAWCAFQSGDGRRARELLDEVVAALGPGPERARALISLARVRGYDDDLRAAEALFRQALDEAGEVPALVAAAAVNLAGILFRLRERLEEAVEHAETATHAAETADDRGWLAEAVGARLLPEAALGHHEDASRTLEAALAVQPECRHRRALAQPLFQVGVVWLWWDELERAKQAFEQLLAHAREMGEEGSVPYVLVMAAQVECVRGDPALAAVHADEGLEAAQQSGQATLGAYLLAIRALAHAEAGEAERARELAARALSLADRTSGRPAEHFARAALGLIELSVGQAAEAIRALGPLVEFLRRERITEPGAARVVPDQIEALIALGELAPASELLDWYAANAARLERPSALAAAARCAGMLHAERGELESALVELERARELAEGAPIPLERGRTLLAHGAVHRRARRRGAARRSLEEARAVFEQMGARAWTARATEELGRVGGRAPSSGELTPTEVRVAELVAEGLQTKQVAAALFVSPKTIEGHLTNVYAKLGVHSRTELARHLAGDGDTPNG